MDSIHAGNRRACIDVESHAMPNEKWSSVMEKAHSFWRLAVTPTLSCGQEWHLDAKLPTDATELESTNSRCSSLGEYSEDAEAPELHLRISWKCRVIMLGWMEEPNIGILKVQGFFIRHIINYTGYNQKWNVNQIRSAQWTVQNNKNKDYIKVTQHKSIYIGKKVRVKSKMCNRIKSAKQIRCAKTVY